MNHANDPESSSAGAWVFGLEEMCAADAGEDDTLHQVAPAFGMTLIRAPEGTPQALRWAAEEIVDQCGPDRVVSSVLLQWLRIEAGDELRLGVESCLLERISDDQVRLHAHYNQWDDLVVPLSAVRRMLIDMVHFRLTEAHHPLPAWRIRRLGKRDWSRRRNAE
ncbi:hypothetical protein [Streptomyces halstedii]|uniref:Uncharacterized protein n=1 Tax=Streptomyces halstedii TaxID=1944 RepID=A0A6N9U112_STRHA|nr:hypothetical protein [Streptomyces halstedii]NEA15566.1 hypothetical protein [Streptomyces halstedii]